MPRDVSKYLVDGEAVPSVTEVLDLAGMIDFTRVPFDILEEARQRGTAVHTWIELQVKHPETLRGIEIPEPIAPYIAAWEKFMADSDFSIDLAEEAVICKVHRYAGTFDAVGTLNARCSLVDWKARYGLTPDVGPQTAGYTFALHEGGILVQERFGLLLRRDGSYRLHRYADRHDLNDFLAAVRMAHFKLRNRLATLEDIRR
jgi:hypothetical protein